MVNAQLWSLKPTWLICFFKYRSDTSTAFAHCISADFGEDGHMTAGVTVAFAKQFGRPTSSNLVSSHLANQKVDTNSGVYALVTEPKYNMNPKDLDYDITFQ